MRMFLVGLCDIFLILYLTTLGQVDEQMVSSLTVADYQVAIGNTERLEHQLSVLEPELKEMQRRVAEAQRTVALVEAERDRLQDDLRQRLKGERKFQQQAEELAKVVEQAQQQHLAQLQTVAALEERLGEEQVVALKQQRKLEQQIEELRLKQTEQDEALAAAELAGAAARRKAEAETARAAKMAAAVEVAEAERAKALEFASDASSAAIKSRIEAERAAERAHQAQRDKQQTDAQLEAITQVGEEAFERNVRRNLQVLHITYRRPRSSGGVATYSRQLNFVPLKIGQEFAAVLPPEQLGLAGEKLTASYRGYEADLAGRQVEVVYLRDKKPQLIALATSGKFERFAIPVKVASSLNSYMPTLIAVRSGEGGRFSDRIRGIEESGYFIFRRDRLQLESEGLLRTRVDGFRGTGDFGQRLLEGDQIVDLDGNYIGVVADGGIVVPVPGFAGWRRMVLRGRTPVEVLTDYWTSLR